MYIEELDQTGQPQDPRQSRVVSQPAALLDQCESGPWGAKDARSVLIAK